jgi:hypothetical protein
VLIEHLGKVCEKEEVTAQKPESVIDPFRQCFERSAGSTPVLLQNAAGTEWKGTQEMLDPLSDVLFFTLHTNEHLLDTHRRHEGCLELQQRPASQGKKDLGQRRDLQVVEKGWAMREYHRCLGHFTYNLL